MVQIQLINKILRSKSLESVMNTDISPEYFLDHSEEYDFILEHYKEFGNVPDTETFLDHFPEFDIVDVTESDEYLIQKLEEEYQYTLIVPIIKEAGNLLQKDSFAAVDYLKSAMTDIQYGGSNIGTSLIREAKRRYEAYKEKMESDTPWMLPTGFKEIDDVIGGFAKGEEFVVFFARTNQGKSWVLAKSLAHNWKVGYNVGVISPEMGADLFGWRFDTLTGNFSNFDLYMGNKVEGYKEHIDKLASGEIKNDFVVATPAQFNRRITVSKIRKWVERNHFDIIGIDGIKYLSDERYKRGDSMTTSLTNISEDLMSLSCELGIPILVVVQANREGANENGDVPALESIRDSDGIAQNATKVFSLRQQDSKLKIKIVKCRTGKVGTEFCYDWDIDHGIFKFTSNYQDLSKTQNNGRQRNPIENKQPLTRRATDNAVPF